MMELETKMQEEAEGHVNRENSDLQSGVLQMLLNDEITAVHFPPGLDSTSAAVVTELWKTLLKVQPPELHTIVCRFTEHIVSKTWDMRPFFDNLLPLFPNLEVLQLVNLDCTDQDLCNIVENLPKLR